MVPRIESSDEESQRFRARAVELHLVEVASEHDGESEGLRVWNNNYCCFCMSTMYYDGDGHIG